MGKRARGEIVHAKRDKEKVGDLLGDDLAYADERLESARTIRWVIEANVRPAVGKLPVSPAVISEPGSASIGRNGKSGAPPPPPPPPPPPLSRSQDKNKEARLVPIFDGPMRESLE